MRGQKGHQVNQVTEALELKSSSTCATHQPFSVCHKTVVSTLAFRNGSFESKLKQPTAMTISVGVNEAIQTSNLLSFEASKVDTSKKFHTT